VNRSSDDPTSDVLAALPSGLDKQAESEAVAAAAAEGPADCSSRAWQTDGSMSLAGM
jgi:hypothetical protein